MPENSLRLCALFAAMLAMISAAKADCAQDIDKFETSFDERIKTERSKLAGHPLVLNMADGRLVDMRGKEPDAKPTERWFVTDEHAIEDVRTGISEARLALRKGDVTGCEGRYNELRSLLNP